MPDSRIAYGVRCTWWDTIDKTAKFQPKGKDYGIPVCPFCKGTLYETPNLEAWQEKMDRAEANGHEGYKEFAMWCQGKCFPGLDSAREAYVKATGKDFEL